MKPIDIVILVILIASVVAIGYFAFWKHRKDPCRGCPYAKHCSNPCDQDKNKDPKK